MKVFFFFISFIFLINSFSQNSSIVKDTTLTNLIIDFGKTYKGTNYKYGSCSSLNNGFDCSGFIYYIFKMGGIELARSSYEMSKTGKRVNLANLKKGDLVFFDSLNKGRVSHVGIITYADKNNIFMLHVSSSKGVQEIDVLHSKYWRSNFLFGIEF